ncbi:MAG: S8/S53 family peptidase [Ignavibacteriaceae bacterium]
MKKIVLISLIFIAQLLPQNFMEKVTPELNGKMLTVEADTPILCWVFFTDKGENTESLFANPQSVVSERSLKRRAKVMPLDKLISFDDLPVEDAYVSQLESHGFSVKQKSRWFNGVSGFVRKSDIRNFASLDFVSKIDIVWQLKKDYSKNLNETESGSGYTPSTQPEGVFSLNYGASFDQLNQINVPAVHNLGITGENVYVTVLDAGFGLLSHEAFDSVNIIAAYDFVNNDPGVGDSTDMGEGSHGTQTLSTIGGYKQGQLIGPAYGATYILAKTENTDSETPIEEDNWIAALEWADSIGTDVTSTSLGYIGFDAPYTSYTWMSMNGNTCRITIGADLAAGKGIVVLNSAGNEGFDPTNNTLGAPSDGDSVIAVGGVRPTGERNSFSSVGNTVDGRIKPDIMARGSSVVVASPYSPDQYSPYASGTSFACPLAAGVAVLVLQKNPTLTPMQVREALRMTAGNFATPNREMGWGILNALNAINYFPITSAKDDNLELDKFALSQNYPNPFNPGTTISYTIPQSGFVTLRIYDVLGNEVRRVVEKEQLAGEYDITFNAGNLVSGIYFYTLSSGDNSVTKKMIVLK